MPLSLRMPPPRSARPPRDRQPLKGQRPALDVEDPAPAVALDREQPGAGPMIVVVAGSVRTSGPPIERDRPPLLPRRPGRR